MRRLVTQGGWSFTGLISVLTVAGIFLSIAFKLAPAYADFYTLQDIMESTTADRAELAKDMRTIKLNVEKKLGINNMKLPKDFLTISKDKGTVHFDVDYEIRTPIFHNVDAVMSFKQRFTGQELE
ncbi:DUF4845 domain-containing protein [Motiliproteus sediminis]|uniref:DUF4845 domain-containing protein n=1 Tax=Motiliproteus sediminis TaxID=1468178 RepID=UPI001AEFB5B5|nr:DUF4845 domain-containing protein [Motiliproteus sediminis]